MSQTIADLPVAPPDGATHRLDASLVRGVAWTSGMRWITQILSWACTVLVARLLTPADYGVVGMGILYLELVTLLNELGLGAAVVTKRALSDEQVAQLNGLAVLLGVGGFLVSVAAAVPLAAFFEVPELRWVVWAMSAACVIAACRTVPAALLERDLRFKTLAIVESVQAVVGAFSIVVFALLGFSYWSLVLGGLLSTATWTGLVLSQRAHRLSWPRWRALDDTLTFGWHILASRLSWYAQVNGDFLVAGRVFGKEVLGAYSIGFTVASMPTEKIVAMVGRVAFPVFAAIQDDRVALRRYLLSLTSGLALLTFPMAFGLSLVADDLVLSVLGDRWGGAIAPLRCLALFSLLQAIIPMLPHILNVTGDSRFAMRVGLLGGIAMPVGFVVGSAWGIVGIAAVWVTVYPLLALPLYVRVFRTLALPLTAYLSVLWPALGASLAMSVGVWAVRWVLPEGWEPFPRLLTQVGVGAGLYMSWIAGFHRDQLRTIHRALRIVRSGGR